jgi:hypothetical protein
VEREEVTMTKHGLQLTPRFSPLRKASLWSGAVAPLLAAYFFVGGCGEGRSGFVLSFHLGKVAVTAAWCEATTTKGT